MTFAGRIIMLYVDLADKERKGAAQAAHPPLQGHFYHEHVCERHRQGKSGMDDADILLERLGSIRVFWVRLGYFALCMDGSCFVYYVVDSDAEQCLRE